MGRLDGKVVVVTGGGSGIGRGACLQIAQEGGTVVVADIREPLAAKVAAEVVDAGGAAASYTASKHVVIGLARHIAVDYGAQGISANAIQPAAVDESNLGTHVREDRQGAQTPTASLPRPKAWLPIRRAGKIKDEYGATIAFLLSDDAGYITGASLPVDGGYLAT